MTTRDIGKVPPWSHSPPCYHVPMKVIILCGGQGTRLREETEFKPKPMVMVGGRPISCPRQS